MKIKNLVTFTCLYVVLTTIFCIILVEGENSTKNEYEGSICSENLEPIQITSELEEYLEIEICNSSDDNIFAVSAIEILSPQEINMMAEPVFIDNVEIFKKSCFNIKEIDLSFINKDGYYKAELNMAYLQGSNKKAIAHIVYFYFDDGKANVMESHDWYMASGVLQATSLDEAK